MSRLFESVSDLESGGSTIRRRSYGVIEVRSGRLARIVFRPWPKTFTADDVLWRGQFSTRGRRHDFCRLYFNQPRAHPGYLALKFIVGEFGTTFATIRCAALVLDEIARLKRIDAVLCHVSTNHISNRLLRRWGWEPHLVESSRRQFIKRFYGTYRRNLTEAEARAAGWPNHATYLASLSGLGRNPSQDAACESLGRRGAEAKIE
jgi:hypothetical protein